MKPSNRLCCVQYSDMYQANKITQSVAPNSRFSLPTVLHNLQADSVQKDPFF